MKKFNRESLRLYLVTDHSLTLAAAAGDESYGQAMERIVSEAVGGGVTMVQLREKDLSTREFVQLALRLKKVLAHCSGPDGHRVPLIINDRIDVALASDADGVHIGQSDMPYGLARRILGPDRIIGLSVENLAQVEEADSLDVDYIGVSPVFATPTKTDTAAPFGIQGLRRAVEMSVHPTVAIGGMNARTVADVMDTGTDGIAVVSAIVGAPSPREAAAELYNIMDGVGK